MFEKLRGYEYFLKVVMWLLPTLGSVVSTYDGTIEDDRGSSGQKAV